MLSIFFIILFGFLVVQIISAGVLIRNRSITPNFCKATIAYPLPRNIDRQDFSKNKFRICVIQDDPQRYPMSYQFRCIENGVVIREFLPSGYLIKLRMIFVPWKALSETKSVNLPQSLRWCMNMGSHVFFTIEGTPILLIINKKYLDDFGVNFPR